MSNNEHKFHRLSSINTACDVHRKEVAMAKNKSYEYDYDAYEYCNDPGCICSGRDYEIIKHNMLDGWSREESEALLGEHKYGGM
jgi:hypothetical protein